MKKIAVIGAGSYGTAMAYHLSTKYQNNSKYQTYIFGRDLKTIDEINTHHTNSKYTQTILPTSLKASHILSDVISDSRYIIMAVPAQSMREMIKNIKPLIKKETIIINLAKGLEMGTFKRMSIIMNEELQEVKSLCTITSLGGPAFSIDIFKHCPLGVALGGKNTKLLLEIRELFDTETFDVKITKDIVGIELGGALKNVFGIMAGVMAGVDMGKSINGDFLTRSIVDMKTISSYMKARRATLDGRAGLGDLAITCTPESRNFRFGREFAKQYQQNPNKNGNEIVQLTLESLNVKTVEGLYTLKPLYEFCQQKNMFVPIIRNLYRVLYEHTCSPEEAVHKYRLRDKIRLREARLPISRLLSSLFPRFWYRREKGFMSVPEPDI